MDTIWSRWADACFHCPTVMASMIAALFLKSCQRAGSHTALTSTLCTIVQGCGYKGYPWSWWWTPLQTSLKRCFLRHPHMWQNASTPKDNNGQGREGHCAELLT